MSTLTAFPANAVSWLDQRGRPAWIFTMVMGFIIFWPVGLGILAYMVFTGRFGSGCSRRAGHWQMPRSAMRGSSGNEAFDAYKADVIDRLEREQGEFEAFLHRLRASKDKAQFDDYMAERAREAARSESAATEAAPEAPKGSGAY